MLLQVVLTMLQGSTFGRIWRTHGYRNGRDNKSRRQNSWMSEQPKLTSPRKPIAMLDHLFQELAYQGCQPLHVLQTRLFVPLAHLPALPTRLSMLRCRCALLFHCSKMSLSQLILANSYPRLLTPVALWLRTIRTHSVACLIFVHDSKDSRTC